MNMKIKLVSLVLAGTITFSLATNAGAVGTAAFTDVRPGDWYYNAVNHVVERNYFNGVNANTFAPHQSMTRAMAVTVLARMFGGDLSCYDGRTTFADVPTNAYYAKAVQWAVDKGIASGTSPATFSPDAYATREQISVFLYNAVRTFGNLGSFDSTTLNGFTDRRSVSSWADTALQWATSSGILNGSDGRLKPKDSTTRAAFATIAMNYDNNYKVGNVPAPTPTPDLEPVEDVAAKENQVNSLLVSAWQNTGQNVPARDTGKLEEAARAIASGDIRDVEKALKSVGFDKPLGTIYRDKYVYDRYEVKSFLATASSVAQAVNSLAAQDSLMGTSAYTDYSIGVYQMNGIQFRVSVVTYDSDCYTNADLSQMERDWLTEQATLPVALSSMEQQVLDLTNKERAKNGLAPLKVTAETQEAASIRVNELPIKLTTNHTRPDGRVFHTVLRDLNSILSYEIDGEAHHAGCVNENFAWGYTSAAEAVDGWMTSTGHRRNILDSRFTHVGISVIPRYENGKLVGYYWEQFFLGVDPS